MVRAGFKQWVEAGFPRGEDGRAARASTSSGPAIEWVRVPHDEAAKIVAAALKNIAETYTGEAGQERLADAALRPGDDRGHARAPARRC